MNDATLRGPIERWREGSFVVVFFVGVGVFTLGTAFFVLGVSVGTGPPAPYMSPNDKRILVASSLGTMVVGALTVRFAARIVGW